MDLLFYNAAEKFIIDSFNKANKSSEIKHFLRTTHWLKELRPDADEALLVSAVAHDIERAYRQKDIFKKMVNAGYTDIEFYRLHEERSAEIIADFLKHQNADASFIERVKMLVSRHEDGGNDDQNLLKDADSLSFFENNVDRFVNEKVNETNKDKVKEKFDWMFYRINSEKAKQIAQPYYEKAIKNLNTST